MIRRKVSQASKPHLISSQQRTRDIGHDEPDPGAARRAEPGPQRDLALHLGPEELLEHVREDAVRVRSLRGHARAIGRIGLLIVVLGGRRARARPAREVFRELGEEVVRGGRVGGLGRRGPGLEEDVVFTPPRGIAQDVVGVCYCLETLKWMVNPLVWFHCRPVRRATGNFT